MDSNISSVTTDNYAPTTANDKDSSANHLLHAHNVQTDQELESKETVNYEIQVRNELITKHAEMCYVSGCNRMGIKECPGLRNHCWNLMCSEHGFIAHKQHWCGGGGCGLETSDKYCEYCKKKANRESWAKLALIICTFSIIAVIILANSF